MEFAAESTATWGIPGPIFLMGFALAAFVFWVRAMSHRGALAGWQLHRELHAYEVAFLVEGRRRAVAASIGALRSAHALGIAERGKLSVVGEPPMSLTPLDQAVLHAISDSHEKVRDIPLHPAVQQELDMIENKLIAEGQLTTPAERAQMRWATLPLFLLLVIGVCRIVAGLINDRPVGILVAVMIPMTFISLYLLCAVPTVTSAGEKSAAEVLARHRALSPAMSPSWSTYGPEGAALGVALFGGAALTSIDPAFAAESEVNRHLVAGPGSEGGGCGGGCGGCGCGG